MSAHVRSQYRSPWSHERHKQNINPQRGQVTKRSWAMALVATAKNLAVSQKPCDEEFVEGSALGLRPKARAADSGLHSFGVRAPVVSRAKRGSQFSTGTPRSAALLTLGGAPLSGALERTVALIASAVPGSAESDAGPIEGAAPRPWWITIPPPPFASRAEQWISDHVLIGSVVGRR